MRRDAGAVETITDGHGSVRRGAAAREFLDELLEQAGTLQSLALRSMAQQSSAQQSSAQQSSAQQSLAPDPHSAAESIDGKAFLERLTADLRASAVDHAAPNPVFTAMIAVNELDQAGLARRKRDTRWDRPTLTNPAPVTGKPHGLSVLPAAAEMLRWKLRRHPG